jgi:hypothetical protein
MKQALQQRFTRRSRWLLQILGLTSHRGIRGANSSTPGLGSWYGAVFQTHQKRGGEGKTVVR